MVMLLFGALSSSRHITWVHLFIYLFYKDSFDPQPDFPTSKADKPEFTDGHYFASTVLKHFKYPQQISLYRGGLQRFMFEQIVCFSVVSICFWGFLELWNILGVMNMPGYIISTPCF